VQKELSRYDVVQVMEHHYGQKNNSYTVVLCPMLHDGGYALNINKKAGDDFYAVVGPAYDSVGVKPAFDVQLVLSDYVLHEFSHNFCNPLIDKYFAALGQDSCLFAPLKNAMKEQGYGGWKVCLYEHMTRANEVVLNELVFGKKKADKLYNEFVEDEHWIYLKGLVPIIKQQYLPNRNKYKTEDGIMSLVVAYLDKERSGCTGLH
jgi:hypothetical protein